MRMMRMEKGRKMPEKKTESGRKNFILWYTSAFGLIGAAVFLPFLLKGNTLVGRADACNQYYPVFVYMGRYLRECLSQGRLKQFDFAIGLGEGVLPALNYYGFGDPLNLFSVFFTPANAYWGFSALILVRLYLCGLSMGYFCRRTGIGWGNSLLAALTWAFSSFTLKEGLRFYTWLTGMMLLPLMLAGVLDIMEDGRRRPSTLFVGSVCLQAMCGFYFLYMDTVFGAVYFLVLCLSRRESLKSGVRKGGLLLAQYLLGLGAGAVILLPAVCGFLNSPRSGGGTGLTLKTALFYPAGTWLDYAANFFVGRGYGEGAQAVLFTELLCAVMLFMRRRKRTEWKLLCGIGLAGYLIPLTGYVMNGFAYVTTRWVYLLHFVLAASMAAVLDSQEGFRRKELLAAGTLAAASLGLHLAASHEGMTDYFRFGLYLVMLAAVLAASGIVERVDREEYDGGQGGGRNIFLRGLRHLKRFPGGLLGFMVIGNILLNGCMIFWPVAVGGDGFSAYFLRKDELGDIFLNTTAARLEMDGEDFARADVCEGSQGVQMALGISGVTEYLSILNHHVSDFFQAAEISPGIQGSTWNLNGLDERKVLLDLLSVKTWLHGSRKDGTIVRTPARNEDALPLGVACASWMTEEDWLALPVPDRDTALLRAVVLEKTPGEDWERAEGERACSLVEVRTEYENVTREAGEAFLTGENAGLTLSTEQRPEGELYVKLEDFYYLSDFVYPLQVGNKSLQVLQKEDLLRCFGKNVSDYWIQIAREETGSEEAGRTADGGNETGAGKTEPAEAGQAEIRIDFLPDKRYSLKSAQIYVRPTENDAVYLEDLREHGLEEVRFSSGDRISGKLALEENRILFLGIPYSSGWSARVNGEESKILRADIGFCAIPLTAGEYTVELRYRTPGMRAGVWLAVLSIGIFVAWNVRMRHGSEYI